MKECKHKFLPRYDKKWSTALKDLIDGAAERETASPLNHIYRKKRIYTIYV